MGKGNTVVITEKKAYIEKMEDIISDKRKFEVIDIEKDKLLNFVIQSEKKVINIIKRLKDEGKITEKKITTKSTPIVQDQAFCMVIQKFISQLLVTTLNFVPFCRPLAHLLINWLNF